MATLTDALRQAYLGGGKTAAGIDPSGNNAVVNPYAFINQFGRNSPTGQNELTNLFNPNPQISGALREQGIADEGARERSAQLGLEARGGAGLPGGYGVAALQSQLGAQSDLSHNLAAANYGELERGQQFKQGVYGDLLNHYLGAQSADQAQQYMKQYLQQQRQSQGKGISLGIGPVKASFASGGFTPDQPTPAVVGEQGTELVIPHQIVALGPEMAAAYAHMALGGGQIPNPPSQQIGPPIPSGGAGMDAGSGGMAAAPAASTPNYASMPDLPTPYQSPGPYHPHGFLENLGALGREFSIGVGRSESPLAKILALALGGASALGENRLAQGEATQKQQADTTNRLNEYQKARYDKELDAWVAGAKNRNIMVPGVPYPVPLDSPVAQDYFKHQVPGMIEPKVDNELVPVEKNGVTVYMRRSDAVGQRVGKATADTGGNEPINLSSYQSTYTDRLGNQTPYVDLSTITDKKEQKAVSDLARKQGVPVLKDASPLKAIDSAHGQLESMGQMANQLEPSNAFTRPFVGAKNVIEGATQAGGQRADILGAWKTARQTIVPLIQGLAAAGKGNRIMQSEIGLAQSGLPGENDVKSIGTSKVSETRKHLDNVAYALLGKKPPRGAAAGGGASTGAAEPAATHVYDPNTDSITPVSH